MEWFVIKDLIGLSDMPATERGIRKHVEQLAEEAGVERRRRQGSKAFEYPVSILSPKQQAALLKKTGKVKVGEQVINLPKAKAEKTYCREALWASWGKTNDKTKQKAQQALRCVQAVKALEQNGINRMHAYQTVCDEYGIPLSTLRRHVAKVKDIDECDWLPALLTKHFETAQLRKVEHFAHITPEAWEFFKGDYLRLERPTMSVCYERLKKVAVQKGWSIPSLKSLSRRLEAEVPIQARVMLREGEHALHQMFPPQERSVLELHALEWINGDGYQHNVFVRWFNGDIVRPKTWFWADVYSRKILGWRCDLSENTDSIRLSFMDVIERYGIPKHITIDNTRAAANKWMTGGVPNRYRFKVKPDDPKGLMTMLVGERNIHWTSVILGKGHGQAKPIERAFGVGGLEEYIDKQPINAGAYTGPSPMAKPDNYGDKAIDADVFLKSIALGVEMFNQKSNRNNEVCRGFMSYEEAFNASYQSAPIKKATKEQLQMLMLSAEASRVSRHGTITLDAGGTLAGRKNRYFNEAMMNYIGQKLIARFDPRKLYESVEIYTLNGVHLCTAECIEKSGFGDTQAAREQKRKTKQFTKHHKAAAKAKRELEALEVAAMMPEPQEEVIPEAKVVEVYRPIAFGNTAAAIRPQEQIETEEDLEANYQASVASLMAQRLKNRL
ncbi:transposase domain-containing protein [Vibrio metoecus]|uniref:transposase domain-containing protein n=1 Tax=Vibrio metoecus TaxID=1481663 RepID=UPI0035A30951